MASPDDAEGLNRAVRRASYEMRTPDDGGADGGTYFRGMDTLLQLEYIIERERHTLVAKQPPMVEPEKAIPSSPLMVAVRNVMEWLRLADRAPRYA